MPYSEIINFSFSIPNQPAGVVEHDLSQLLQKMMTNDIKLRSISGFASGRRIKIFCVPEDANHFRDFLRSARIRASRVKQERHAFLETVAQNANRGRSAEGSTVHLTGDGAVFTGIVAITQKPDGMPGHRPLLVHAPIRPGERPVALHGVAGEVQRPMRLSTQRGIRRSTHVC